jgi:hypothetical protein
VTAGRERVGQPPHPAGAPASGETPVPNARDGLVKLIERAPFIDSDDVDALEDLAHDESCWLMIHGEAVLALIDAVAALDAVDNSPDDFVLLPVPHPFTTALEAALDAVLPLTNATSPEAGKPEAAEDVA